MNARLQSTSLGMVLALLLAQTAFAETKPAAPGATNPAPPTPPEKPVVTAVEPGPGSSNHDSDVAPDCSKDKQTPCFGLNDRLVAHVDHLSALVKDKTKCSSQAVLYLNGLAVEGLQPNCDILRGTLVFHLSRASAATAESWCAALGGTATGLPIEVSVGLKGSDPAETQAHARFRVYNPTAWGYVPGAALLLLVLVLGFGSGSGLLRDSVPGVTDVKDRPYSLSRCQFAGWMVLLFGAFCLVWISTGEIPAMTPQLLGLLGLTGGTLVGGAAVNSANSNSRSRATVQMALAAQAAAQPLRVEAVAPPGGAPAPVVVAPPPPAPPPATLLVQPKHQNFLFDILGEDGALSPGRLQHAVWTLVLWVLFALSVSRCFGVLDIDKTLLGLAGISSLVYGTNKLTEGVKGQPGSKS